MGLSKRRADAVKAALVQAGVPAASITAVGVGESQLLVPTPDGVREPQNRRVVISGLATAANWGDPKAYCKALSDKYREYEGGLYPEGNNERPKEHNEAGLALAKALKPLGTDGKPADGGKIVMISVGMSNTTQEFSTFKRLADSDTDKNPDVVIVDGAQGGMTAARIKDPGDNGSGTKFWEVVDQRLKAAGATREQVQVAWIKEADAGRRRGSRSTRRRSATSCGKSSG